MMSPKNLLKPAQKYGDLNAYRIVYGYLFSTGIRCCRTSIRTLKTQLEKMGHNVFIFTTTDRDVDRYEDWQIIRIPSVPFFAFKDRRVAYRGFSKALEIAKQYKLRYYSYADKSSPWGF